MSIREIYGTISDFCCFGTSKSSTAGSQTFFLNKQSEVCQKFHWDHRWSSDSKIHENRKSYILSYIYYILYKFEGYIERFQTFIFLVLAGAALRDLRHFFSANNLKLVNFFIEITDEALTAKYMKIENHIFCLIFITFCANSRIYWTILDFYFFSTNRTRQIRHEKSMCLQSLIISSTFSIFLGSALIFSIICESRRA